jgi:glyoxylase-like metal-dependent hydrolase (beta-lactamase superfamily II)
LRGGFLSSLVSKPASLRLGEFEIIPVLDGYFCLDGGSMFGVVPRVMWEKKMPPDERHRIRLASRCLLVRNGKRTVLIDSGQGNKQSQKFRQRYAIDQPLTLLDNLRGCGVRPEEVTDVVNCHLHFDHAGWNTIREKDRLVPTFLNARYWSQRGEWERAQHYREQRDQASFLEDDFLPLEQPRWELVDGESTVMPGIELLPVPGHSLFTQGVLIRTAARTAAFLGDLIPTRHHVPFNWIAGFDLHPVETFATKRRILPRAARENWLCIFDHDPELVAGRLAEDPHTPGTLAVIPAEEFPGS